MMNKKIQRKLGMFVMLLGIGGLSSCSLSDPVQVEDDFGNSVRHMVEQQKQALDTEQTATEYKPPGLDGDSALNSLDQYRAAQKRKEQKESLESFGMTE